MERAAAQYPVVSVNGPRQSGKTTLLAHWRALAGPVTPATLVYGGAESYVRSGVDVRAWRDWV